VWVRAVEVYFICQFLVCELQVNICAQGCRIFILYLLVKTQKYPYLPTRLATKTQSVNVRVVEKLGRSQ